MSNDVVPHVVAVGSGPMPRRIYAMVAEFPSATAIYQAAEKVRDKGHTNWDCYSPHPIHGLEHAMGLGKSWVGLFTICGGAAGLTIGLLLQLIPSAYVYPMITQGKPYFSLPGFMPILDLLMIISMTVMSIGGMITMNLLPRLYHPLFEWEYFKNATRDKYFIVIEAEDPKFHEKNTAAFLTELGGTNLTFVGEPGEIQ